MLIQVIDAAWRRLSRQSLISCWLPLLAWMGAIFWFSSQPDPLPLPKSLFQTFVGQVGHMIGYAMLSLLWWRVLARHRDKPARHRLVLAFLLTVAYGLSDEYHQTFVPGRSGNLADVLIDAVGSGLGLWLLHRWQKRRATDQTT